MAFRFYLISRNACLANTSLLKLCFETTIWNNYKYKTQFRRKTFTLCPNSQIYQLSW